MCLAYRVGLASAVLLGLVPPLARPAAAQTLRGRVVDSTTGRPVVSGFVVLVRAGSGEEVARVLGSRDGQFVFRLPGPGSYVLRSERIGYKMTVSESIEAAAGATVDYDLEVSPLPVRLAEIGVRSQQQCDVRPEEGLDAAVVWEEARKALAAATWTEGQRIYRYDLSMYARVTEEESRRVTSERSWTASGQRRVPFAAVTPSQLAAAGYVVERSDGSFSYLAPDAAVLLHPSFLDGHCFSVEQGEGHRSGLIALRFRPVHDEGPSDVDGALWLDARSNQLSLLEYRYTNLPHGLIDSRVGGTIEFMPLGTGTWVVREWRIRMPTIGVQRVPDGGERYRPVLLGFEETGGEVTSVKTRAGESIYASSLTVVRGTVFDSTRQQPLGGAVVRLDGTSHETITDDAGNFYLVGPFDGNYRVTFEHPRADALGFRPSATPVVLATGDERDVRLAMPPMARILSELCPAGLSESGRVIHGRVTHGNTAYPVPGARVRVTFRTVWQVGGTEQEGDETQAMAVADEAGNYAICGVPSDQTAVLFAEAGSGMSQVLTVSFSKEGATIGGELFETSQIMWRQDFSLDSESSRSASVTGHVTTEEGDPAPEIRVTITGTSFTTRTDANGQFALEQLPRGSMQLSVAGVGVQRVERDLVLQAGQSVVVPDDALVLRPLPPQLDPITVAAEGEGLSRRLETSGFFERASGARGHFYTRLDIQKWDTKRTSDAMRRMAGVRVNRNPRGGPPIIESSQAGMRVAECRMIYYIDGMYYGDFVDLPVDLHVPVDNIEGIEIYSSSAQLPAQYSRSNARCGAVVFWTR